MRQSRHKRPAIGGKKFPMAKLPKSDRLQAIDGGRNKRKRPAAPDPSKGEPIARPDWLPEDAAKIFDDLLNLLRGRVQTSKLDQYALADLAQALAKVRELEKTIDKEGMTVPGHRGVERKHPLLSVLAQYRAAAHSGFARFALSPLDRRKLGVESRPEWEQARDEMELLLTGGDEVS